METSSNERPTDKNTIDGFLSGFIEAGVEMPADGLNGECIVHYAGEHSRCEMIVTLVDGEREGVAVIVNDGVPFLRLEYQRGSLTGVVERLSEFGLLDMRGHLENGMETGLFLEYDENEKVVWIGYYRNGERSSEVRNRVVKSDCLEDGSGEFYELDENGKVTQLCLYVNGVRSRVIQRFNGEVMTELDEDEKRVYEGGFKGDVENGFVREGKGKEFVNGGREAVYSGEWKNGKRDGQGTEYKRFNPVYYGGWEDGKKNGKGKEMDERGKVVRRGVWVNGFYQEVKSEVPKELKSVVVPSSLTSISYTIEEMKISNSSTSDSNATELKLSGLDRLKRIVMGDYSFGKVRLIELDGLSELESVVIGQRSFRISDSERIDGACRIANCPKLISIQIGDRAFNDYHSFELNNLPSLQSIDIGDKCFYWAPLFSLTGLIDWLVSIHRSSSTTISQTW